MRIKIGISSLAMMGALLVGNTASADCWTVQQNATYDSRWYLGLDNTASADDLSVLTDNAILKSYYPSQCGGTYGCDVVSYQIQWFSGSWSGAYYPGVNDIDWVLNGSYKRRVWSYFYDHRHQFTFCN